MEYNINNHKVAGVVKEASRAIGGKGFNYAEIIFGLAELTGRVIVDAAETGIQVQELSQAVAEHMARTINTGAHAQNKASLIERV